MVWPVHTGSMLIVKTVKKTKIDCNKSTKLTDFHVSLATVSRFIAFQPEYCVC